MTIPEYSAEYKAWCTIRLGPNWNEPWSSWAKVVPEIWRVVNEEMTEKESTMFKMYFFEHKSMNRVGALMKTNYVTVAHNLDLGRRIMNRFLRSYTDATDWLFEINSQY